jgi:hypothetical protein
MAMYGNRGLFFSSPIYKPVAAHVAKINAKNTETLPATSVPSERVQQSMMNDHGSRELDNDMGLENDDLLCHAATSGLAHNVISDESGLNFLQLLLLGREEFQELNIEEAVSKSALTFRVEIVSAKLRSWMNLEPGEPCFHDIALISLHEPNTMHKSYVITQMDVTAAELANRAIKQANAELAEERERIHALLQRQYELIDILRTENSKEGKGDDYFTEKINFLRSTIAKDALEFADTACAEEIRLDKILGRGSVSDSISGCCFPANNP